MNTPITIAALALAAAVQAGAQQVTVEPDVVVRSPTTPVTAPTTPPQDAKTAAKQVEKALDQTPGVSAKDVTVSTHAETVVISGEVRSEAEAARAEKAAEQAAGGARISNQIDVQPGADQALLEHNARLVREVESALRRDPRTANLGVAVSIDERRVIGLHGLVPSRDSRAAAEDVASRVAGVDQVSSRITVPGE